MGSALTGPDNHGILVRRLTPTAIHVASLRDVVVVRRCARLKWADQIGGHLIQGIHDYDKRCLPHLLARRPQEDSEWRSAVGNHGADASGEDDQGSEIVGIQKLI